MSNEQKVDVLTCVEVAGKSIPHNTKKWSAHTNRHPTSGNQSWGWIEGTDKNVWWENGTSFNHKDANEAVHIHNQWLDDQRSPLIKFMDAEAKNKKLKAVYDDYKAKFEAAEQALQVSDREMVKLLLAVRSDA